MKNDAIDGSGELWGSRDFLRHVIDSISDPILVIDPYHRIVFINKAAQEIYEVKDQVGIHLSCYRVIHNFDRTCDSVSKGRCPCPLRYVVSTKERVRLIHKSVDKSDKEIFIEVSAWPVFNDTGDVVRVVLIIRDITKMRQEEEQRERLILDLQKVFSKFNIESVIAERSHEMLPVCMSCKKIRNGMGNWKNIEEFIKDHWKAEFTHGICRECEKKLYDADKDGEG